MKTVAAENNLEYVPPKDRKEKKVIFDNNGNIMLASKTSDVISGNKNTLDEKPNITISIGRSNGNAMKYLYKSSFKSKGKKFRKRRPVKYSSTFKTS